MLIFNIVSLINGELGGIKKKKASLSEEDILAVHILLWSARLEKISKIVAEVNYFLLVSLFVSSFPKYCSFSFQL